MSWRNTARAAKKAKEAARPAPLVFDTPPVDGDPADRADLNKLAEQIENGIITLAPDTGSDSLTSVEEKKPGPVLAEPPKPRTWEGGSDLAYPARPIGAQDEKSVDRRRDPVDLQLRAISARLPRLIEQAVNELEARSKAELDRRFGGSMKAFDERLAALDLQVKENSLVGAGSRQSAVPNNEAVRSAIQQLKAENKEQLASISFYKVAFCMLTGAVVFGAVLFFHFLAK